MNSIRTIITDRTLLLAGAIYFTSVALCHAIGWKFPGFFVFYDIPSTPYQDRIISFLAFGWAVFFFTAASDPTKNRALIRPILIAGAVAIIALAMIISSNEITRAVASTTMYWVQTGMLGVYWVLLFAGYRRS